MAMGTRTYVVKQIDGDFRVKKAGNPAWDITTGYEPGYSPTDMLAISAGACIGFVYQGVLTKSNVDAHIEHVAVTYEKEETTHAIAALDLRCVVTAETDKDADRAERYLEKVPERCPVLLSLNPKIAVTPHADITVAPRD